VVKSSKRRGISTIVGGLIFLILMTSAFSTFYIAFDVQQETINTQRDVSRDLVEKTQEQFVISAGADPNDNNRLGIQVKNQGPNPVEVANIWIVNKSDVNEPANRYEVNYQDVFIPPGYGAPILENTPLYLNPAFGNDYTVKVISTLGSIKSAPVSVSGSTNLLAELFTIPPDVRQGENVTIALRVTNVGNTPLVDVEPHYIPPDVKPSSPIDSSEFISPTPVTLDPTESTIFTWHYKVSSTASVGTKVAFTSAANGTDSATGFDYLSNNSTDKIIIRDPQGGSGDTIVIKDELFGKPGLFMIIPGPFGESEDKGLWGMNIANPTEQIMEVNKVVISLISTRDRTPDNIFEDGSCSPVTIPPTPSDWDCSTDNQLIWAPSVGNSFPVPPKSVSSFLATVYPGTLDNSDPILDSILVQGNVWTTLGQFGKTGYGTSMQLSGANDFPIASVYLTDDPLDLTNPIHIQSVRNGIPSGSTQTFNVALTDFDDDPSNWIEADFSKLIINIPKDWTNIVVDPTTDFSVTVISNPDNSHQIVGDMLVDIDGFGPTDGNVITFHAKAPTVPDEKMYVFYILADGYTDNLFPIGPLAEVVLQVVP